jgi:hypothetical protein
MVSMDEIVNKSGAYCYAMPGELYLVYLPANSNDVSIKLEGDKSYSVKWFNPREGGALQNGTKDSISQGGNKLIGNPPSNDQKDWVVVIQSL